MALFRLGRKHQWDSYAFWQRDVYAKTIRDVIGCQVVGQPVKTSASAASFTLSMFINPDHPDADAIPSVTLRPAAEGALEITVGKDRRHHFFMPTDPDEIAETFQKMTQEIFGGLMPMPLRPGIEGMPSAVAV